MKKLLLLGLAMALASAAFAYPTLTGPTGLATLPTSAVVPSGQLDLAADYYNTSEGAVDNIFPLRVEFGVANSWEIGAAYLLQDNPANTWVVNTKFATPLQLGGFGFGVGAQYAETDLSPTKQKITQVYAAASRVVMAGNETTPGLGITLGANWTRNDLVDVDKIRGYAGVEAVFAKGVTVAAEYQTKASSLEAEALWSAAARFSVSPAIGLQVGWTNGPFFGAPDHNLFAGVNFALGAGAE